MGIKREMEAVKLNEAARTMGSKGGKTRAKRLTAKQLTAIGRKGAAARWGKAKGGAQ